VEYSLLEVEAMQKRDGLTKGLAVVGTVLLWFPIFATVAFSGMRGFTRLDWLMPAELFPVVAVGAAALLWAAIRARTRVGLVAWGVGIAAFALVASMAVTSMSGLASGAVQPEGARFAWTAALVMIGLYTAAIIEMGVAGVLIVRDLFAHHGHSAVPAA